MKALLICPDERPAVSVLSGSAPLANVPILGESLLEYWLARLVLLGAQEVLVLAADRAEQVRSAVGDGARWGLRVNVIATKRELTGEEAREEYHTDDSAAWLPAPHDVVLLDRLPSLPQQSLFGSYEEWFAAARALMPLALTPDRLGVHEVQPGVWLGLHTHVAPEARLLAPCWIGERAWIEPEAVIGPETVIETGVVVGRGAEVARSLVGPHTFVGQFTEVRNSIAWGHMLVNWERDSCVRVPDEFLLCSLAPEPARHASAPAPLREQVRSNMREFLARAFAELVPPH